MQRSVYGETQFKTYIFHILKQLLEKIDMPYTRNNTQRVCYDRKKAGKDSAWCILF